MDAMFHFDVDDAVSALERLPGGAADLIVLDPGVSGRSQKVGSKKRAREVIHGQPSGEGVRGQPSGEGVRGQPSGEGVRGQPSGEGVRGQPSGEIMRRQSVVTRAAGEITVVGFPAQRWPSLLYEVMRVLAPGRVCWWVCESAQSFMAARAAERMGFSLGAPMVWDRGEQQAVRLGFILPLTRGRPRSPGAELVSVPRPVAEDAWPGELPEGLCHALIEAATAPGDLVIDPFCGSGAVGAAAIAGGRRYLGSDRSEFAVSAARARLAMRGYEVDRQELLGTAGQGAELAAGVERAGPRGLGQLTMFTDALRTA